MLVRPVKDRLIKNILNKSFYVIDIFFHLCESREFSSRIRLALFKIHYVRYWIVLDIFNVNDFGQNKTVTNVHYHDTFQMIQTRSWGTKAKFFHEVTLTLTFFALYHVAESKTRIVFSKHNKWYFFITLLLYCVKIMLLIWHNSYRLFLFFRMFEYSPILLGLNFCKSMLSSLPYSSLLF